METPLLFYSVNTYLAFLINQQFYNNVHFVWCSPVFDSSVLDKYHIWKNIPPSSNPKIIYERLRDDIAFKDLHSSKIRDNRNGIKAGAARKLSEGVINEDEFALILQMVDVSDFSSFRPLIYIIPDYLIDDKLEEVPVNQMANPLSKEFRIVDLKKFEFDIIEI